MVWHQLLAHVTLQQQTSDISFSWLLPTPARCTCQDLVEQKEYGGMSKRNITKFLISVQFHHLSIADKQNIQQGIEDLYKEFIH
jgi:hypothetical protein